MKAKKSLGQNWLRSETAREAIIKAAELDPTSLKLRGASTTVLEVGPGQGFLTEALLQTGARVIAVEKDDRLISELQNLFKREIKSKQLKIIHGDILEMGEEEL